MKKRTSKKALILRSLLLLPLLAILLFSFSETKTTYTTTANLIDNQDSNELLPSKDDFENTLNIKDSPERSVELAGLILNSETLAPLKNVEIRDSEGNLLSRTDDRGYYKARFDKLNQEGELLFEYSLYKDGYQLLSEKEHWGDLQGEVESVVYFGLQKERSNSPEFSEFVARTKNLSYESVIERYPLVKERFEFKRKINAAKTNNELVFYEIENENYLVNNSSWIKIGSKDDLISIDDNRIVKASEVNEIITRKEITGMTPLDSNKADYAIYTIPVDHIVRPIKTKNQIAAEKIVIKINRKGQLLFKERLLYVADLKKALQEINKELTYDERKTSVRAIIITDSDAPKKKLDEIEQILESYGVAQIDIVGPENSSPPPQNGATPNQLSKYNSLAKKYNAQPKEKRVIPSKDVKSLETIYRKMSKKQKAKAEPFPECPDSKLNQQEGAAKKQLGEYNALAKKYNTMLANGKSIRIKKSDVDRLEYLHGLMTHKQRENAEPFPDFPEPPAPPVPPSAPNLNEKEMADEVIDYIIANQDPHDRPGGVYSRKTAMVEPQEFFEISPKAWNLDLKDNDNIIYHYGKKISYLEMMQMQKDGEIKSINVFKNASGQKVISITSLNEPKKKPHRINPGNSTSVFNYHKPEESNAVENDSSVPSPPSSPNRSESKNASGWSVSSGANRDSRNVQDSAPIPPVAPTIAMHVERDKYSKELKSSINEYLEANKSYEKAINEYRVKGNGSTQNLWNLYNLAMEKYVTYHVLAKKEGNFVQPVPAYKERDEVKDIQPAPPTPPKPRSPLDHVIEMAKKDAQFFYKGKEINSDQAIELMKKNKNLNIDSKTEKGKKPVVKLSTEPYRH